MRSDPSSHRLFQAQQPGEAQIYPECIQVDLTSSGTSFPAASDMVSFQAPTLTMTQASPSTFTKNSTLTPCVPPFFYWRIALNRVHSRQSPGPAVWSEGSSESPAATESAGDEEVEASEDTAAEEADEEASATTTSSASATATASQQATVTVTQCAADNLHKRRLPKSPHY